MSLEIHMNVGGCFRSPAEDIELAKTAVDAGFEGIWIGDHFHPWLDTRPYTHHVLPWLGAVMNEVPEVPVGTSVSCPLFRYEPPVFAQALATLDNMSPDRLEVALGVGEALNEAPFTDTWPDWGTRAEMLVEAIEIMRELWDTRDYLTYEGDHYQYEDIQVFTPPKSDIDINWAAWGPQSSQLAGTHGDGVLTTGGAELVEKRVAPNFRKGWEGADRQGDPHITNEIITNIGDPDELVAEARERGEMVPVEELDNPDPRSIQSVADEQISEMSDAEIRDELLITDDPSELLELLQSFEDAGVTRVIVMSNLGDPYRVVEAFEETILPAF
ncbi:LLM class flavin-dependent oxidoreductase [Halovenus marina]|uniref:LLM class flavin-dependent oxidoreductase n=1 Tax=Halovenus marina TaxID=3396621 RepID=UPI003F56F39D